MNQLALRLPVEQAPRSAAPAREELRKATRCSHCKRITWDSDTFGGECPDCTKEHHAEILGDDVG